MEHIDFHDLLCFVPYQADVVSIHEEVMRARMVHREHLESLVILVCPKLRIEARLFGALCGTS